MKEEKYIWMNGKFETMSDINHAGWKPALRFVVTSAFSLNFVSVFQLTTFVLNASGVPEKHKSHNPLPRKDLALKLNFSLSIHGKPLDILRLPDVHCEDGKDKIECIGQRIFWAGIAGVFYKSVQRSAAGDRQGNFTQ
jgi:hypothetical protein